MTGDDNTLLYRVGRAFGDIKGFLSESLSDLPIPDGQDGSLLHLSDTIRVGEGGTGRASVEVAVYDPERWAEVDAWFRNRAPVPGMPGGETVMDLLSVLREALALPVPGTAQADEKEARRLGDVRLCNVVAILAAVLAEPASEGCLQWAVGAIRRSIEQNPVTYAVFEPREKHEGCG